MIRASKRIHGKFSLIDLAGAWNYSAVLFCSLLNSINKRICILILNTVFNDRSANEMKAENVRHRRVLFQSMWHIQYRLNRTTQRETRTGLEALRLCAI